MSSRNATPERNTAPSATRHGSVAPAAAAAGIAVSTKKKFSPMPGACAIGSRAYSPISAVANAAERQVAVVAAPKSSPVGVPKSCPESTAGCTKTMYAIVRNVVTPGEQLGPHRGAVLAESKPSFQHRARAR